MYFCSEIDEVIFGNVVLKSSTPNIAREIIIDLNLPRTIPGVTVSRGIIGQVFLTVRALSYC